MRIILLGSLVVGDTLLQGIISTRIELGDTMSGVLCCNINTGNSSGTCVCITAQRYIYLRLLVFVDYYFVLP